MLPHKRTVGAWLDEWVDRALKPPRRAAGSYDRYKTVIRLHLKPLLGPIRLQELRPDHIERYYVEKNTYRQRRSNSIT